MSLDDLRYVVFSPKNLSADVQREVYLAIYNSWKRVWGPIYREVKNCPTLYANEFLRQDLACALFNGPDAIAVLLQSFYDIENPMHLEHAYMMSHYDQEFFDHLRGLGHSRVMTFEFLTVTPEWRKNESGISYGDIIFALGLELFQFTERDAIIVITRNSRGVNQSLYQFGFRPYKQGLTVNGEAADQIYFDLPERKAHPRQDIETAIQSVFDKRIDYSGITTRPQPLRKVS